MPGNVFRGIIEDIEFADDRRIIVSVLTDEHAAERLCYLTTTGRVSGNPHEIEIWFARDRGDRIFMLSGGGRNRDWVLNLINNPAVTVRIAGSTYTGAARPIEGEDQDPRARQKLDAKYHDWTEGQALTDWAQRSFPVEIDLLEAL